MQHISGEPQVLRAMSADLESLGRIASSYVGSLSDIAASSSIAGSGTALNALRQSITHIQHALHEASEHFSAASRVLIRLADEVESLEREADAEAAMSQLAARGPGGISFGQTGLPELRSIAVRQSAANDLENLARAAPWLPPQSTFLEALMQSASQTIGDAGSAIKDEIGGIFAAGKFLLWDGTTQALVNTDKAGESWQRLFDGIANAVSHPDDTIRNLAGADLMEKDPAAWAAVGLLSVFGSKGLSRVLTSGTRGDTAFGSMSTKQPPLRAGIDRGDGRDFQGRYTGSSVNHGVVSERQALDDLAAGTGLPIIRSQVPAHRADLDFARKYDGLIENDDGTFSGIEVKSGSAYKNVNQRTFDDGISVGNPATARLPDGREIKIVQVFNLPG